MNTPSVYPSLLAIEHDPQSWARRIAELTVPITGIHYDIGDGLFVPTMMLDPVDISYIFLSKEQRAKSKDEDLGSNLPIDVHLMVRRPSEYFSTILSFPAVRAVAFHVECDEDIHETIQALRNAGKSVGLALLETTPADHLDPYLLEIDYVIVMTIEAGYSGMPFIPEMLTKISEIHNKRPELPIVVDGGIGGKTLPLCAAAGATRFVMSSALFGTN